MLLQYKGTGIWLLAIVGCASGCFESSAERSQERRDQQSGGADLIELVSRIDRAEATCARQLQFSTQRNTPWEIAHLALALGPDAAVLDESGTVRRDLTAREYFQNGGPYITERIYQRIGSHIFVRRGTYSAELERHPDQFLAILAQLGLGGDVPVQVDGEMFMLSDLMESALTVFDPGRETTFTLIAMSRYTGRDDRWHREDGTSFTINDVLKLELDSDSGPLPCGGTHRLFALASAVVSDRVEIAMELQDRARQVLAVAVRQVKTQQLPDGGFEASLTCSPSQIADSTDERDGRIHATGHILEWLMVALDADQVRQPWIIAAGDFLAAEITMRLQESDRTPAAFQFSAWSHGLHGLRMLRDRLAIAAP